MRIKFLIALFAAVTWSSQAQASGAYGQAGAAAAADAAGAIANAAAAGALSKPCFAVPPNIMACIMMAQALAQVGANGGNQSSAGKTQVSAAPIGSVGNYGGAGDAENANKRAKTDGGVAADDDSNSNEENKARLYTGTGLSSGQQRDLDKAKKIIDEAGYKLDGDKITTPDGNSFSSASLSSPSSSSGLSDSQLADVKSALATAKAAVGDFKLGGDLSTGGGGGGRGHGFSIPEVDPAAFKLKAYDFNQKKPKLQGPQFMGFNRSLAGEKIGVAGDDIFDMVHRRYKAKRKMRSFLP